MTPRQPQQGNSTSSVLGRRLGSELLRIRTAAGLTQPQAAKVLSASTAKIAKMEGGWVPVRDPDIRALCDLYGVHDPGAVGGLLELARIDRERRKAKGWWDDYRSALGVMHEYVTLEHAARTIRTWQPAFIPGLLQTPDYVRRLRQGDPTPTMARRQGPDEEFVTARLARQQRLHDDRPLHLHAVIYEAALRNFPGGAETARGQLDHLSTMTELPNVSLQVYPFSSGPHLGLNSSLNIISFAEPGAMDVVYSEVPFTQLWIEGGEGTAAHVELFQYIAERSLDERQSALLLHSLRKEL
ncbi:helix-turn-helix domain-containing protein [Streptomyces sp. NPDC008313]|uniref:helix-turn-helix domain-containing protein n=1 Tax=Streptomyces sp. NPDC008313 TaxID=3364826 RepID=UPI0036E8C41B